MLMDLAKNKTVIIILYWTSYFWFLEFALQLEHDGISMVFRLYLDKNSLYQQTELILNL